MRFSTVTMIGLAQIALAIIASLAASGIISFEPELLAAILAAQSALSGGSRLRPKPPPPETNENQVD